MARGSVESADTYDCGGCVRQRVGRRVPTPHTTRRAAHPALSNLDTVSTPGHDRSWAWGFGRLGDMPTRVSRLIVFGTRWIALELGNQWWEMAWEG